MIKNPDKPQGDTTLWLLDLIEHYIEQNEMDNDGYSFGWLAVKDGKLVTRLRDGGDVTLTRMDELLAFMRRPGEYRARTSEGLVWKTLKPLTIQPRSIPHD